MTPLVNLLEMGGNAANFLLDARSGVGRVHVHGDGVACGGLDG